MCPRCQSTIEAPGQDEPTAPVAPAAPVPICPHCGKAYDAPVQLRRAPRVRRLWPAVVGAALVLGAVFLLSGFLGGLHARPRTIAEFRAVAAPITFAQLAADPDALREHAVTFHGKVLLIEKSATALHLRVNMTQAGFSWTDLVLVTYTPPPHAKTIRNGDVITVWGTVAGHATFEDAAGKELSVPQVNAAYLALMPRVTPPTPPNTAAEVVPAAPTRHRRHRRTKAD